MSRTDQEVGRVLLLTVEPRTRRSLIGSLPTQCKSAAPRRGENVEIDVAIGANTPLHDQRALREPRLPDAHHTVSPDFKIVNDIDSFSGAKDNHPRPVALEEDGSPTGRAVADLRLPYHRPRTIDRGWR